MRFKKSSEPKATIGRNWVEDRRQWTRSRRTPSYFSMGFRKGQITSCPAAARVCTKTKPVNELAPVKRMRTGKIPNDSVRVNPVLFKLHTYRLTYQVPAENDSGVKLFVIGLAGKLEFS